MADWLEDTQLQPEASPSATSSSTKISTKRGSGRLAPMPPRMVDQAQDIRNLIKLLFT